MLSRCLKQLLWSVMLPSRPLDEAFIFCRRFNSAQMFFFSGIVTRYQAVSSPLRWSTPPEYGVSRPIRLEEKLFLGSRRFPDICRLRDAEQICRSICRGNLSSAPAAGSETDLGSAGNRILMSNFLLSCQSLQPSSGSANEIGKKTLISSSPACGGRNPPRVRP